MRECLQTKGRLIISEQARCQNHYRIYQAIARSTTTSASFCSN